MIFDWLLDLFGVDDLFGTPTDLGDVGVTVPDTGTPPVAPVSAAAGNPAVPPALGAPPSPPVSLPAGVADTFNLVGETLHSTQAIAAGDPFALAAAGPAPSAVQSTLGFTGDIVADAQRVAAGDPGALREVTARTGDQLGLFGPLAAGEQIRTDALADRAHQQWLQHAAAKSTDWSLLIQSTQGLLSDP